MAGIEERLAQIEQLRRQLAKDVVKGTLLLVDLAGSTSFKTENPEADWLIRLTTFYDAVEECISPTTSIKFLGDGVLAYFDSRSTSPNEVHARAQAVLAAMQRLNTSSQFPGSHQLIVRIVLTYGPVYLLKNQDPQGTTVDKLFRLEKYVPDTFIAMTQDFCDAIHNSEAPLLGRFSLRGLAAQGKHSLYLDADDATVNSDTVRGIRHQAQGAELWWLPAASDSDIFLVGGYIPPGEEPHSSVQVGDKDAYVQALLNLTQAGSSEKIHATNSAHISAADVRCHLVCIGGPCYNTLTKQFLDRVDLHYCFFGLDEVDDLTPIFDKTTGCTYHKWEDPPNRLRRDWGMFARFRNPHNTNSLVLLAAGIESPAVHGGVCVFSPSMNSDFSELFQYLMSNSKDGINLPEFSCVIPFDIEPATNEARLPDFSVQIQRLRFF